MNTLLIVATAAATLLALLCFLRLRALYRNTCDQLPTGLCVVGSDERVRRWNRKMEELSGTPARECIGKPISELRDPWPAALGEALADPVGGVIKQSQGDDPGGATRWFILRSSATIRGTRERLVLIEDISEYQRMQDELLHSERLASIGRLAAGVAHEIGNPITGIACVAQNLTHSTDPAELEQGAAEILKQTDRISRTVNSLMQLSHPGSSERDAECVPCNLADCIDEAIHLLALDQDVTRDSFDNRIDRELLVRGDAQLLLQVCINLLDNARSACDGLGPVRIDAQQREDRVNVFVDNPGSPIAPEVLSQVFEPFFTTKDVGEGTGLGLPLVRRMLEDMGGSITLHSPCPDLRGGGTRAELTLQRADYDPLYGSAP